MRITVTEKLTITGAPAPLRNTLRLRLRLANPVWQDNQKMNRWNGQTPQFLDFAKQTPEGLVLPRGIGREVVQLCREMGGHLEIVDYTRLLPEVSFSFAGDLRGYQQKAVDKCLERRSCVLEAGTGTGKTVMALAAIAARKQPTLIIVHTKELLNQWRDRIEQFLDIPCDQIGVIGDGRMKIGERITAAIINSLYPIAYDIQGRFGHVIIDECHRCPSRTFSEAVSSFDSRYLLGLSATPYRRDGLTKLIGWYLGGTIKVDATELTSRDIIQNVQVIPRKTDFQTRLDASEQYSRVLSDLTQDEQRNKQIVDDIVNETKTGGGVCLVLSDRRGHCENLNSLLAAGGVRGDILTGATPKKEREAIVERLGTGDVRVLIATTQLISKGFDAKALQTLFLASPIKFSGRLIQSIGRILRPAPGKTTAKIYDYVDENVGVLEASGRARQWVYKQKRMMVSG